MPLPQTIKHTAVISVLLAVVVTGGLFAWQQHQKNNSDTHSFIATTVPAPVGCSQAKCDDPTQVKTRECAYWCSKRCDETFGFPQFCDDSDPCTLDVCGPENNTTCHNPPKCTAPKPICDRDNGAVCVQCLQDPDCPPDKACNTQTKECVDPTDVGIEWPANLTTMEDGSTVAADFIIKNYSTVTAEGVKTHVEMVNKSVRLPAPINGCRELLDNGKSFVYCDFGSMEGNAAKSLSVSLINDATTPCSPTTATLIANVTTSTPERNKTNNDLQKSISITCPPTDVEVQLPTIPPTEEDTATTVNVTVSNNSLVDAKQVVVTVKGTGLDVEQVGSTAGAVCQTSGAPYAVTCTFATLAKNNLTSFQVRVTPQKTTTCTARTLSLDANITTSTPESTTSNNSDTESVSVICSCGNGQSDPGEQCDKISDYSCKNDCTCESNFTPSSSGMVCTFSCPAQGDAAAITQFCDTACVNAGPDKPTCVSDCKKVCMPKSSSSKASSQGSTPTSSSGGGGSSGGTQGGTQGGTVGGTQGGTQGGTVGGTQGGTQGGTVGGTQGGAGGTEGGAGGATGGDGGSSGRSSSRVSSRSSSRSSSSSSRVSSVSSSRSSSISSVSSQSSSISSLGSSSSLSSLSSFSSSSSSSITACFGNNCLLGGNAACIAQQKTCVPNADPPNCFVCVGSSTSSTSSRSSVSSISSRSSSASSISSVQSFSSFAFFSSARFCGNNILEPGEECEASQIPSDSDISCISCRIVFNVSCGDGRLDSGEECDDGNEFGSDGCSSVCDIEFATFNPSSSSTPTLISELPSSRPTLILPPHVCGDGTQELGETCDDGNNVSGDGCSASCKLEEQLIPGRCGDGLITLGEECDDGNARDFDGCTAQCKLEVGRCGDGILQTLLGEQCEPSLHTDANGIRCGTDCRLISPTCGNAKVEPGEECDEGAANHSDTLPDRCRTNCSAARCGDRVLDAVEQCDDGNRLGGDGCDRFCRREAGAPTTDVAANIIELPSLPFPPFTQQPPTASLTPIVQTHAPAGETGPAALAVMAAGAAAGYSWVRRKIRKQ